MRVEYCDEEKTQYSKYILQKFLPFLNQLHREQMVEKELEANVKGKFLFIAAHLSLIVVGFIQKDRLASITHPLILG